MGPLIVDTLYFYPRENALKHNTVKYEVVNEKTPTVTIVRRGQPFSGVVRFTRPYDEANDIIQLVFTLGDKQQIKTRGSMFVRKNVVADKYAWSATLSDIQQRDTLFFEITTPVDVAVGCWAVQVVTRLKNASARRIYEFDQDLYILFNPWNPDDQTYMADSSLLQEYVLNDVGKIWVGSIKATHGRPWFFGQFDKSMLPACMFMLNRAKMPLHQRGDPVKMVRVISQIVNSNDDDGGVLSGRWDGKYEDGTAPEEWTGSIDILAEYYETQQEVQYGQCWVFAGVVTAVCRALGIPSRVVTNVVSAHDANATLSIDKYYTENMEELHSDPENPDGTDSIWNFHVWNDVWMARPDLPPGYGGWQAIDATPQESSGGLCRCGPAPLEAIKQGQLGVSFDVEFMLATVNADFMRWRHDPYAESGYSVVETNNYHIGRIILTKKPYVFDPQGDKDREDITCQYKHREGTASERVALMNGVRHSERAKRYYAVASNLNSDVTFKLQDIDTVPIGKDFSIVVDIKNSSNQGRHVKTLVIAQSIFYHGVRGNQVKKVEEEILVEPKKSGQIKVVVKADEYLDKLVEYCNMKISVMAIVDETKQSWADDDDIQVLKPKIIIKFNEDLVKDQLATASLSFTSPLDKVLTGCEFRLTSTGIAGRTLKIPVPDAEPRGVIMAEIPVKPHKVGTINFVATFKSKELKDINGAATAEAYEE